MTLHGAAVQAAILTFLEDSESPPQCRTALARYRTSGFQGEHARMKDKTTSSARSSFLVTHLRSVPQVEVTFDINTNGHLTKEEIKCMVSNTEKFKGRGSRFAYHYQNGLESYVYHLCNSITDEKVKDKFDADNKTLLETAVNEAISWLDNLQEASKEEYKKKQKELKGIGAQSCEVLPICRSIFTDHPSTGDLWETIVMGRGSKIIFLIYD
ncbi:hypothetical protein DFH11DRAFT_1549192 [Phellopilus nigrolimitatus]|nr:hypothetical protein DFH11DRAFT_1549192 [Phellopilus nigrolimitatus]